MQVAGEFPQVPTIHPLRRDRAQIAAEAEVPPGTREHHGAHIVIARAGHGGREQIHGHLQIDSIRALGAVQPDDGYRTTGLDLDGGCRHIVSIRRVRR